MSVPVASTDAPLSTADLAGLTAPRITTELPGPIARSVIERDERVTSPSLTRVYPLVVARGSGAVIEDVDGNRFLDFNAGIAVNAAGHAHPAVTAADARPGRCLLPLLLVRLLPPGLRRAVRAAGSDVADAELADVPRQLRHRGGRGRAQARPPPHPPPERDRLLRRRSTGARSARCR